MNHQPMSRREICEQNGRIRTMLKYVPRDLSLVILLTLSCTPFVLVPPLNETPVRVTATPSVMGDE